MGLLARALLLDDGCLFFEPPTSSKSNERATFSVRRRPGALGFGPSGSNSLVPDLSLEPAGLMGICASLARLPHACHKTPSPGARPGISCFLDFLPEGEAELSSQACMQLIPRPGLSVGCGALDLVAVRLVAFHCDLIVANALRAERHASAAGAFETRFARQYRHLAEGASGGITPAEPFVCLGAQCPGDLRPRRFPFMPSSEQPVGRPAALSFCARAASDRGPPSSSGSASTAGLLPDVLRALARAVLLLDCQMVLFSRESWGPIACGTRVGLDPALEQHLPGVDALLVRAGLLLLVLPGIDCGYF
ncbi:hypothetical protein H696_04881 [Fonticula alba]|uniref:Uncharacterized protein n=1 Tax=Fonticula alba TaxID=691883 RepID=A0A058Z2T3_FONAL|nr:hypothetical protein H696_04881 [Fonticula alba]KCV68589.1 hypothetical protein H696_04881 [Fonticula alba]|eukprot:XP_009497021.1 hypothetical protein H696_04881 [Fonticula alba]